MKDVPQGMIDDIVQIIKDGSNIVKRENEEGKLVETYEIIHCVGTAEDIIRKVFEYISFINQ